MDLKYIGLLFVLIVIVDAISGSAINNMSSASHSRDLPATTTIPEKFQVGNGANESIKITPDSPEITSKLKLSMEKTTTTTTTITPAPPTTTKGPEQGHWTIRNETSGITCVIAQMTMQLNITYPGESKELSSVLYVPKDAIAKGNCSDPSQALSITWGPGHSLRMNFSTDKTMKNFFVSGLDLNVIAKVFNNATDTENKTWHFSNRTNEFLTPMQMSYKCSKVQDFNLTSENAALRVLLSMKDMQLEAYMKKTEPEFGIAKDCDSFDTPDIVPIAVACALTVLVLVVLAAYLIGRKRSQSRGYLSM